MHAWTSRGGVLGDVLGLVLGDVLGLELGEVFGLAVVGHGLPWLALFCRGKPWFAVASHGGLPWLAMACLAVASRGMPWLAVVCRGGVLGSFLRDDHEADVSTRDDCIRSHSWPWLNSIDSFFGPSRNFP